MTCCEVPHLLVVCGHTLTSGGHCRNCRKSCYYNDIKGVPLLPQQGRAFIVVIETYLTVREHLPQNFLGCKEFTAIANRERMQGAAWRLTCGIGCRFCLHPNRSCQGHCVDVWNLIDFYQEISMRRSCRHKLGFVNKSKIGELCRGCARPKKIMSN